MSEAGLRVYSCHQRPPPTFRERTLNVQKTTSYREQSRIFLTQVYEELAKGDIPQTSEKAWGATAQMFKAIAQERGWPHRSHQSLYGIIRQLRRETGDPELTRLFNQASGLHSNFYENLYEAEDLEDLLPEIERLVDRLEALLSATP